MPTRKLLSLAVAALALAGCNLAPGALVSPTALPSVTPAALPAVAPPAMPAPGVSPHPLSPQALLAIPDYAGPLPDLLTSKPEVERLYRWAAPRQSCLQYFHCTCGCEGDGHTSNWNCYVKKANPDGTYEWDLMSYG